ncbi:MAG: hypothetical protein IT210_00135 [Armatimonadetes bacterium]|nr:hypothetical protein [Armatimonadota bacterium]
MEKGNIVSFRLFCVAACVLILSAGCGSGGREEPRNVPLAVTIQWAARSRALQSPSSALSAGITLEKADPAGQDFTYSINRDPAPDAYTRTYHSPKQVRVGNWDMTVLFYAHQDGAGDIVGESRAKVTVLSDGSGIGDIATEGTIDRIAILPDQSVSVGERKELALSVLNKQGQLIALTPGSIFFTIAAGDARLKSLGSQVEGVAPGPAQVKAAVDNRASSPEIVTVESSASDYRIALLGKWGGGNTVAYGINNADKVAGASSGSAALWQNGRWTVLDLGDELVGVDGHARCINDADQVSGSAFRSIGAFGFLWQNGRTLISFRGSMTNINSTGQVAVWTYTTGGPMNGSLWDITQHKFMIDDIGVLPGFRYSVPLGVNNASAIVGRMVAQGTPDHAFLWQNGQMLDLGPGRAYAINNTGQSVGATPVGEKQHAVMWHQGQLKDLGTLGGAESIAYNINDAGQIVGAAQTATGSWHAFLWEKDRMADLNDLIKPNRGWVLRNAYGINRAGKIVGDCALDGDSFTYGFLLSPPS